MSQYKELTDARDPYEKVLADAVALHDVAMENVPGIARAAQDLANAVLREVKARPKTALAVAGTLGFFIAVATSR